MYLSLIFLTFLCYVVLLILLVQSYHYFHRQCCYEDGENQLVPLLSVQMKNRVLHVFDNLKRIKKLVLSSCGEIYIRKSDI